MEVFRSVRLPRVPADRALVKHALGAAAFLAIGLAGPGLAAPDAVDDQPLGQFLLWSDGNSFTDFGANASVTIDLGAVGFACDFISPTADVYVVPSGSVAGGGALADVSGTPNTVIGAGGGVFVGETIGFTAPTGTLGAGTYAVVFDECQDGFFDAGQDACFDPAFTVTLPSVLPPIDPAIQAIKTQAGVKAAEVEQSYEDLKLFFNVATIADLISTFASLNPIAIGYFIGFGYPFGTFVTEGALKEVLNQAAHWGGIAADPPDPNYQLPTVLEPRPDLGTLATDPLVRALHGVGGALGGEARVAEAFLHSIERYQGAQADEEEEWALMHARQSADYAELMMSELDRVDEALGQLSVELAGADTAALNDAASVLETLRLRLEADGLEPNEEDQLAALGLSPAEITEAVDDFVALQILEDGVVEPIAGPQSYANFDLAAVESIVTQALSTNADLKTALAEDMVKLAQIASELDGVVTQTMPMADAGGPYSGDEGSLLSLDASGSADPDGDLVAYDWDLDGDGAFDDVSGLAATIDVALSTDFATTIGLRVTDNDGKQAVSYASLVVNDVVGLPVVGEFLPAQASLNAQLGETLAFSVGPLPRGEGLNFDWSVDGALLQSGASPSFLAIMSSVGVSEVRVEVSIDDPLAEAIGYAWQVGVVDCAPAWATFGAGWPGTNGEPSVTPLSPPAIGTSFEFALSNSAGVDSPACLIVSTEMVESDSGFGATFLLGSPFYSTTGFHPLPAAGTTHAFEVPDDPLLCGVEFYLQMFQLDAGASHGLAFSPGVVVLVGR